MSPSEIADVSGMRNGNIRYLLFKMVKAGEAQKTGRGRYIHPENQHLKPEHRTPGNNANNANIAQSEGGNSE
jgi:hypothetical protein